MYKIHCESTDCNRVIGEGADHAEAHENAIYENGHDYHDEAGVYTCEDCVQAEMNYYMQGFDKYFREYTDRQMSDDHDDYVSNMEMMIDRMELS